MVLAFDFAEMKEGLGILIFWFSLSTFMIFLITHNSRFCCHGYHLIILSEGPVFILIPIHSHPFVKYNRALKSHPNIKLHVNKQPVVLWAQWELLVSTDLALDYQILKKIATFLESSTVNRWLIQVSYCYSNDKDVFPSYEIKIE